MSVTHADGIEVSARIEVSADCIVRVIAVNGECIVSVKTDASLNLLHVSLDLIAIIAKRVTAPRKCLHLVWPVLPASRAETTRVDAQCIVSPMNCFAKPARPTPTPNGPCLADLIACDPTLITCDVCNDPCPDADDPASVRSGADNCSRCHTTWLCAHCRVQMEGAMSCDETYSTDGLRWCCFKCLEENDDTFLLVLRTAASERQASLVGWPPVPY